MWRDRVVGVADDEAVLQRLEVDLLLVGDQVARVGAERAFALCGLRPVQLPEQVLDSRRGQLLRALSASRGTKTSRITGRSADPGPGLGHCLVVDPEVLLQLEELVAR